MSSNFRTWQQKIQQKRKKTPRRQFVKEIASWKSMNFYKGQGVISKYPQKERVNYVPHKQFYENRDDLLRYGIDISGEGLFQDFAKLFRNTPLPALTHIRESENSPYADFVGSAKYAYLSVTVFNECENVFYSEGVKDYCRNIINSMTIWDNCESVYWSSAIFKSREVFYSRFIKDSSKIWFCSNMQGCFECIRCDGITNKSYCIDNQQLSKSEYAEKKAEILSNKQSYEDMWSQVSTESQNLGSLSVSGNSLVLCRDVEQGKFVYRLNEGRNVFSVGTTKGNERFYDVLDAGSPYGSDFYGIMGGGSAEHIYCSCSINGCSQMYYSFYCDDCSYCIGCVGLKNKSYCIFNKQYEKDEWYEKVDLIFGQMEEEGVLGEFFPGWLCPFYFNDTTAALIEDFTKQEAIADGYLWRDEVVKVDIPEGVEVVKWDELGEYEGWSDSSPSPENGNSGDPDLRQDDDVTWTINPSILKKVIEDEEGNYYRIIPMEYKFLKKYGLPLPRKHWLARLKEHFVIE